MDKSISESICEIFEEIKETMCDKYCKYPEQYADDESMWEEQCENCPMCKL